MALSTEFLGIAIVISILWEKGELKGDHCAHLGGPACTPQRDWYAATPPHMAEFVTHDEAKKLQTEKFRLQSTTNGGKTERVIKTETSVKGERRKERKSECRERYDNHLEKF